MPMKPRVFSSQGGGVCTDAFENVHVSAYGDGFVVRDVDESIASWRLRFDADADEVIIAYEGMTDEEAITQFEDDVAESNARAAAEIAANA